MGESRAGRRQAAQLVEANEQLVLATLRAQTDTETAARALKEVSRSAELDALTELPNRVLLLDRFARAIANAKRRSVQLALLFLDINRFKQINDALGHAAGDQVLKLVAQCLVSSIREADTVSRHGGDEFVILLTEVSQASDAVLIAEKVIVALGAPSRVGDHVLRLTASIGISIYPDDGEDAETLIDRADAAMYRAKRRGLGGFVFHGEELGSERSPKPPALESLQQPLTHYQLALAEHERRHAQLREANEQLVRAALDVSRAGTGKLRLERQAVEMAGIVDDAVDICRPAMDTRLQHFGVQMPSGPVEVYGDPVRLAQILGNLLDNASKYTPDGGEIGLSVVLAEDAMVMTVSDNGIGITAAALPNVFELFVQDTYAIGFNGMGLGIGLTVVRELVEAHGGSVVASSAGSGLGSRFVVTLPLAGRR